MSALTVNGIETFVAHGGQTFDPTRPAVLLVHGAGMDHSVWALQSRALAAQGHHAIATKLIEWRYLIDRNSGASFAEIDAFLKANATWPMRNTLFARAEAKIAPNASSGFVLGWFAGREPESAAGKICLGEAENAAGKTTVGGQHIREGWIEGSFSPATEQDIVRKFGPLLPPDIDAKRLDSLLWRGDYFSARRQKQAGRCIRETGKRRWP